MRLQKYLGIGTLIGVLGFSGCKKEYLEGTVEKEAGTVAQIVESSGALFGNESVKLGNPTYIIQVKTSQGIYTISVIQRRTNKTLEALSLAIEKGDRVRFVKEDSNGSNFGEDRIGSNYADEIAVYK